MLEPYLRSRPRLVAQFPAYAPVWSPTNGDHKECSLLYYGTRCTDVQPLQGWLFVSFQICCRPWVSPTAIQIKPLQG